MALPVLFPIIAASLPLSAADRILRYELHSKIRLTIKKSLMKKPRLKGAPGLKSFTKCLPFSH